MTNRRVLLKTIESLSAARLAQGVPLPTAESDRTYWTGLLTKLAEPVLENLARGTLKRNMPVECAAGNQVARRKYSHLEAMARLLDGIAPWIEAPLEAGAERNLQQRFATLAREAIQSATDPVAGLPQFLRRRSAPRGLRLSVSGAAAGTDRVVEETGPYHPTQPGRGARVLTFPATAIGYFSAPWWRPPWP